jgi:tetratricopeptide (TPR) repeat protein/serine phosphatase RsbU (regulator of sigma subunit)
MRLLFYILLHILFYSNLIAQQAINYPEKALQNASGVDKVVLLNQFAEKNITSNPVKARNYAQEALNLAESLALEDGKAKALKIIGNIYFQQGNNSQALQYFLNSLKIYEHIHSDKGIAENLNNIGGVYYRQGEFKKSRTYFEKVLALDEKLKNQKGISSTLNNIGDTYYETGDSKKALEYYDKSLQIRQKRNDKAGIAESLKNIGLVYFSQNNYPKALDYYFQSLKIDQKINNLAGQATTLKDIANAYLRLQKTDLAEKYALQSIALAEKINLMHDINEANQILSEVYYAKADFQKAYEAFSAFQTGQAFLFNEENEKKIADLQTSYELEKKQKDFDIFKKEQEIKAQQRLVGYVVFGLSFGFVLILAFVLYRSNRHKQKANQALQLKNAEINQQKEEILAQSEAIEENLKEIESNRDEIARKNLDIESSIRYAQRIQRAMLPSEEVIYQSLPLHFIYYRPRDVVSGDFYWFYKTEPRPIYEEKSTFQGTERILKGFQNEKIVITAVDCTGHGVPGAFMSMIGESLLNQIITDKNITEANLILNELHDGVRGALRQKDTKNQDGMDIALCVIDYEAKVIEYAGAKNSLIYVQNGKLQEAKADAFGIGGNWFDDNIEKRNFTKHTIDFSQYPVTFYLYSDGYQDQFGGSKEKKFMKRRFKELLFEIHKEPMSYQKNLLHKTLTDWMRSFPQMDDILVIGVRVE